MKNIFILKKVAQVAALAGAIVFSAAGVVQGAGTPEQTGEYGDMSKQGSGSTAPEPHGYKQQPGSTSGGYDKPHDKRHDNKAYDKSGDKSYDKPHDKPPGQSGGSSGQSGSGGY